MNNPDSATWPGSERPTFREPAPQLANRALNGIQVLTSSLRCILQTVARQIGPDEFVHRGRSQDDGVHRSWDHIPPGLTAVVQVYKQLK